MSRIVLLAPGDLITRCEEIFKRKGVRTKVVNSEGKNKWTLGEGDGSSESRSGTGVETDQDAKPHVNGRRGEGKDVEPRGLQESNTNSSSKGVFGARSSPINNGRDVGNTMGRGSGNDESPTAASMSVLLGETKKQTSQTKEDGRDRSKEGAIRKGEKKTILEEDKENGNMSRILVLSEDIAQALSKEYDIEVMNTNEKMSIGEDEVVMELGGQLIRRLSLPQEVRDEQNDEVKRLRRLHMNNNGKRKTFKTVRVDSERGLATLLNLNIEKMKDKKQSKTQPPMTRVTLVTNDIKDVDKAHIMLGAPTGDVGWKELARKATQRSNIRAYVYNPSNGDDLFEVVDTLLDVA
ncbi:VP6 [CHeRI orbivirus 1]|nr:VP6 [CHeRI orbivirus 1]